MYLMMDLHYMLKYMRFRVLEVHDVSHMSHELAHVWTLQFFVHTTI